MRALTLLLTLLSAGVVSAQSPDAVAPEPEVVPALADDQPVAEDTAIDPADPDRVSIEEVRRFVSVFRAVKQAYVEPIDDATLMRAAIRGLLHAVAGVGERLGQHAAERVVVVDEQDFRHGGVSGWAGAEARSPEPKTRQVASPSK